MASDNPIIAEQIEALAVKVLYALKPWKVVPESGKPIIASETGGNLFRGFIATWPEADLVVALVNNLPAIVTALRQAEAAPGVVEAVDGPEHIGAWKHTDSHFWQWLAEQHVRPSTIKALRNGLATLARQHGEREDCVLVPREPTEAMYDAGYDATRLPDGTPQFADAGYCLGHSGNIYRAMIAAAPATDVGEG